VREEGYRNGIWNAALAAGVEEPDEVPERGEPSETAGQSAPKAEAEFAPCK
jgi:hypothetical protein